MKEIDYRPWRIQDAADVAAYADNPKVAANLRNVFPHPYTVRDAQAFIASCIEQEGNRQLCRAVTVDGRAVGSIGVFCGSDVLEKSAELGYWLGEPYWGQGIMTDAVKQICQAAFERFDIVRIFAEPFAYNQGSRRVLEKAGFMLEGIMRNGIYKNGQIYDYCMYALLKAPSAPTAK